MTSRELEEYRALRDTIRERGTARVWLFLAGFIAWGALTIVTAALASLPVATFLPLLILAATYEAVFSIHVGVERVGRYVQVYLEGGAGGWEHAAMAFGRPQGAPKIDPLFSTFFVVATILNFVPVLIAEPVRLELGVVGFVHLLFVARVIVGKRAAGRQRAIELERFRALRASDASTLPREGDR